MDAQPRRSRWPVGLIILVVVGGVGVWWRLGRAPVQAAVAAPTPVATIAPPVSEPLRGTAAESGTAGAGVGAIEGQVTTTRSVPPSPAIRMNSEPYCMKAGKAEPPSASIDARGRVHWASVRIVSGASAPAPTEPLVVDQHGCQYTPRVQNAVVGQAVSVRNEDGVLHNVHSYSGPRTLTNRAQPPNSPPVALSADATVPVLKLKCDVHPWMTGYVVFNKNPFFAVSDPAGHFRIDPAPAGHYTLHVWHEVLGEMDVNVQVVAGQTTVANVVYAQPSQ